MFVIAVGIQFCCYCCYQFFLVWTNWHVIQTNTAATFLAAVDLGMCILFLFTRCRCLYAANGAAAAGDATGSRNLL